MSLSTTPATPSPAPALYVGIIDIDGKDKVHVSTVPFDADNWEDNTFFATVPSLKARHALKGVLTVLRNSGATVIEE